MLDLVHALAIGVRGLPVLFVTLARPELLDQRGLLGGRAPRLHVDHARPARRRTTRANWPPGCSSNGGHVDEVIRVAEGNPLFIEQLAASVGEIAPGKLPTNIREIVAARLDALPAAERALLLDAAVVGKLFWVDALRAMGADGSDVTRPARGARAARSDSPRADVDHRRPAAARVHARADPRCRLRPAAARRSRPSSRARGRVLRQPHRLVRRGDRRARTALA